MARQVSCPGCQTVYKLADDSQGNSVKITCKKCDKVFVVGNSAAKTGVQATKKPAAKSKPDAPARKSGVPVLLILLGLFVLGGLGAAGAMVGGYFLFLHKPWEATPFAQNDEPVDIKIPQNDDKKAQTVDPKDKTPTIDPKDKTPKFDPKDITPTIDPKDKTPTIDPKDKTPTIDPKDKTPTIDPKDKTPTVDPKDKTPTVDPKDKTPTIDPKDKKPSVDPMPPKKDPPPAPVVALYQLKEPPTPSVDLKLEASAHQLALTPNGKKAVVVRGGIDQERRALIVELPSGRTAKNLPLPSLNINCVVLTPDGRLALIGGDDERINVPQQARVYIRTLAVDSGKIVGVIKGPKLGVVAMAMAPDLSILACGESRFVGTRGVVHVISLKDGSTLFYKEQVHRNLIKGIALTPDKKYVISTGVDNGGNTSKIVVFDIAARAEKYVLSGYPGTAEGLAVSADGKYLAAAINAAGSGGSVRVWDIETGAEKLALITKQGGRGANRVVFGPDDKTIIASFYDSSIRVFDLETGSEQGGFRGHIPNNLVMAPTGKFVVSTDYRDLKIWQFPDSLARLTKTDQPPWVEIVRDGKSVAVTTPMNVRDDAIYSYITNVTIEEASQQAGLYFTVNGKRGVVTLQPTTKFFDAAGKPVPADQAKSIYRLGNTISVKSFKVGNSPAVEVRLVKEGLADVSVANVKLKGTSYPGGVIFEAAGKVFHIKFGAQIRYVDHEGKEMPGMIPQKFLNSEDIYAVKLHREAGEDLPILVEARLTPPAGQLPALLRYPLGIIGAKAYKNALLRRVPSGKRLIFVLVPAGGEPIPIFPANETKAYDVKGKEVPGREIVFYQDLKVDAVILPRAKSHVLLEARALVPFTDAKPPPPPVTNIVEHKNVEAGTDLGRRGQFLKIDGKKVAVSLDPNIKSLDKDGKEIAPQRILQNGNRVDVKLNDVDPQATILEVRLVNGSTLPPNGKAYEGWKVSRRVTKNVYALTDGNGILNVLISKASKAYDADGKSVPLDQVLRLGEVVNVIAEARPRGSYPLVEVRAVKGK